MKRLIAQYISKLTIEQLKEGAKKEGITLSEQEFQITLTYIKIYWQEALYGDERPILEQLKKEIKLDTYNQLEERYYYYKKRYQDYL